MLNIWSSIFIFDSNNTNCLSPDPWKRDAREKAEKQQQLHIVDLLDKEIQELQVGQELI